MIGLWEKHKKHIKTIFIVLMFIFLNISILLGINMLNDTSDEYQDALWKQSVESELENKNETFNNEIYNRYHQDSRDLMNYQYSTGQRLKSLENRVESLEKSRASNNVNINNTNNNNQSKGGYK